MPRRAPPARSAPPRWSADHEHSCSELLSPAVWLAVRFGLLTGLRRSELARLTWREVQGCNLALEPKPRCVARTVPLHSRALQLLSALEPGSSPGGRVFAALGPARNLPEQLERALLKACRQAGLPLCRWSDLRAAYRHRLSETGYPADLVGQLAGLRRQRSPLRP